MRVRVYDKERDTYFKSEVYAIINSGYYEKLLVLTPEDMGSNLMFYDYLDKTDNKLAVLVNSITLDRPCEWIYKKSQSVDEQLGGYKGILDSNIRFFEYIGFSWLWDDSDTLVRLLQDNLIPLTGSIFENNLYSDIGDTEWHYVETQDDVDILMNQTCYFHDSIINEINYVSGGYVDSKKSMGFTQLRKVMVKVDSQISNNIEMIFEGVTAMNLRPPADNYFGDIFGASIILRDASIFFCDDELEQIDTDYEGTWICAYSLKWRFVINANGK